MTPPSSVEVLIVGAGPSGLALATTLAQSGLPSLVVDRQAPGTWRERVPDLHLKQERRKWVIGYFSPARPARLAGD